ncbi:HAMP domain-containing histidine kinase [Myxococcota bacterium]|nr:HAMP domain-containing histidine kinase [Myxococcota bacterium]MBU1536157.1 HAMP domain-containing histidine kinase [Myxococcota bacterium]
MDTQHAVLSKTEHSLLLKRMALVSEDPIVGCLMKLMAGVVLVLDENRQIIGVNQSALAKMGIAGGTEQILGLRPGEAFHCKFSKEDPNGCGNTPYCETCGAALAIISGLNPGGESVRYCSMTTVEEGGEANYLFRVTGRYLNLGSSHAVLVLFEDVTLSQLWSTMHNSFLHDLNNTATALIGTAELLDISGEEKELVDDMKVLSRRLSKEIDIHRCLLGDMNASLRTDLTEITLGQIYSELTGRVRQFHDRKGRDDFRLMPGCENIAVFSDFTLLLRVIFNMVTNAMEATRAHETVTLGATHRGDMVTIFVHNPGMIPVAVQRRIFQLHFSTKSSMGRGTGTASMRLIGERFLGGSVGFVSTESEGTVFTIELPSPAAIQ